MRFASLKVFLLLIRGVQYVPAGLEAVVFTSEGDMRQAINNLQSTCSGFGLVSADNVYKVCDQPHPVLVAEIVKVGF